MLSGTTQPGATVHHAWTLALALVGTISAGPECTATNHC
jgi:hypothetical protein